MGSISTADSFNIISFLSFCAVQVCSFADRAIYKLAWPRPAPRLTARVNPTIHERNAQPCIVGAGLAPALGAARDAAIDPILEFLHLTPIGRWLAPPCWGLSTQDAHLPVCTQLDTIGGSKDPPVIPGAMPVAGQQPIACSAGMALARPVYEPLLHQVIISTHGCCWDDSGVVGCPSHDQRIELLDDPRLWSCLQLLQPLINGSQVALARFLAGGDDGLDPRRVLLATLTSGDFFYRLLANTETQEIKAYLSLIGRQSMREACFVSMEM